MPSMTSEDISAAAAVLGAAGGRSRSRAKLAALERNRRNSGRVTQTGWILAEEDKALGAKVLVHERCGVAVFILGRDLASTQVYRVTIPWQQAKDSWRSLAREPRRRGCHGFRLVGWKPKTIAGIFANVK